MIDDDPVTLQVFKLNLEREGFEFYSANSGVQGIETLHRIEPDVVVLDLMMPIMDGWQVCKAIRNFSQIPILAYSAVTDTDRVMQAHAAGATDYMVKPVPPEVMVARLKRLAERH